MKLQHIAILAAIYGWYRHSQGLPIIPSFGKKQQPFVPPVVDTSGGNTNTGTGTTDQRLVPPMPIGGQWVFDAVSWQWIRVPGPGPGPATPTGGGTPADPGPFITPVAPVTHQQPAIIIPGVSAGNAAQPGTVQPLPIATGPGLNLQSGMALMPTSNVKSIGFASMNGLG